MGWMADKGAISCARGLGCPQARQAGSPAPRLCERRGGARLFAGASMLPHAY
jgi:hypothetical protein